MKVKVNAGWQLGIEGEAVHQPGDIFNAPDEMAEAWIANGQAVAVKAVAASENKAVTASKNKSVTRAPKVVKKGR